MHTASCHCGNIKLKVEGLPETVTACNCSICHRLGAEWAYYQPAEVIISHTDQATKTYAWGDQYIDFHHCPNCGCATHYTTTEKCDSERVAINSRMFDYELIRDILVRKFDGAESWKYID